MKILTIRTDKPEAEVGVYIDMEQIAYHSWQAHRALAETLHHTIVMVLEEHNMTLQDLDGVVVFRGPGSFTGLRIGITVANALGYGLNVPVVAEGNDDWITTGIQRLLSGERDVVALPEYGAPVHITVQKK